MEKINKKNFKAFLKEESSGFTLIETIAAIGIISIGFVGSLILLTKSSAQATYIKNRVVAIHLAAEGIEGIRNVRDTNFLGGKDWLNNLTNAQVGSEVSGVIDLDFINNKNKVFDENVDEKRECLNWNGTYYFHTTGPTYSCNTNFYRKIILTKKSESISGESVEYLEVKSIVRWKEKGITKSLTVIDNLYDWGSQE